MMATPQSPTRMFNGLSEDDALYSDAKYAHEINDKMRVPKRIRATGEFSDEDLLLSNQNGIMNSWNYHDKIDMNVPDRIVVLGHEEHLGTRSAPREILLENSILPKDPGFVRVATPPRVITLNDHHFPSASDQNSPNNNGNFPHDSESPPPYVRADGSAATMGFHPNRTSSRAESDSEAVTTSTSGGIGKRAMGGPYNTDMSLVQHREGTPIMGDLTPPEEILYLRRQLAKLNRRVLSIEIDNVQRSQREKIVYCMGLAYFLLKAIFWLNRN